MPRNPTFGTPDDVDHHIQQLAKAISRYQEARDFPLPEHLLRRRLLQSLRAHDCVLRRRAVADNDYMLPPDTFKATEGLGEHWKQSAEPNSPRLAQPIPDPDELQRRAALEELANKIAATDLRQADPTP